MTKILHHKLSLRGKTNGNAIHQFASQSQVEFIHIALNHRKVSKHAFSWQTLKTSSEWKLEGGGVIWSCRHKQRRMIQSDDIMLVIFPWRIKNKCLWILLLLSYHVSTCVAPPLCSNIHCWMIFFKKHTLLLYASGQKSWTQRQNENTHKVQGDAHE